MDIANFEEYESYVELSKPSSGCAVTMYEAEGWGVAGLHSDDILVEQKMESSPAKNFVDVVSMVPLACSETYWRGVQTPDDYGEMARLESELHFMSEEMAVYLAEINNVFSLHEYSSSSVESEMQEALISLSAKINKIHQCCDTFSEKQPFLSEETIRQAVNQTDIIKIHFGLIAAAESINNLYNTRLNTFLLTHENDALKHARSISYMLDDIEKVVAVLESDVHALRDKSVAAVNTLKRSLDSVLS